jgi:Zn-finger nucleic acid-binding protein
MITDLVLAGNIVIDTCDACDLVWLDAGELQRGDRRSGSDRGG